MILIKGLTWGLSSKYIDDSVTATDDSAKIISLILGRAYASGATQKFPKCMMWCICRKKVDLPKVLIASLAFEIVS